MKAGIIIIGIAKEIASAYLLLAVLLAPYLYYVFAQGLPNAFYPATAYSNDVLTFLVPTPVVFVGGHPLVPSLVIFWRPPRGGKKRDIWDQRFG